MLIFLLNFVNALTSIPTMEFNKLNVGTIFFLTFCNRIHYLNSFKIISTISCYIFRLTIFHIDFYMKKKKKIAQRKYIATSLWFI